ncbi:alpha/beta hydrolase fold domain-containing protein [Mangrovibacterium sp.]|uniref:alpha/beta hydrolase fold domain-containing protein n=1 Tax=Mangrovibacterium sp. TaxID=1961364 RepID=UPI0035693094
MKSIIVFKSYRLWTFSFVFFLSSLTLLYGQTAAENGFVDGVNYKKNVVYKTIDGKRLVMDIFYPKPESRSGKAPWMVFVHGGGWAGGNKENIFKKAHLGTLQKLIDKGVVCVTIDYRLARSPVTTYESVVDCKDAARFLLKNAEQFKLDENKYGIWGGSAGGHLSLVTALVPDSYFPGDEQLSDIHPEFKCIASFFPFTSCLNPELRPGSIFENGTLFTRLLGGTLEEKPELARLLSPTEFLEANSPSILLLHGDKDLTLPIINSHYMLKVAKEKNADVELLVVKNGGHSFSGGNISPSFEEIADSCSNFILSHLGKDK